MEEIWVICIFRLFAHLFRISSSDNWEYAVVCDSSNISQEMTAVICDGAFWNAYQDIILTTPKKMEAT
jgi:hypothetical protein